ncbi:hypothetical protein [Geothrix limicola]|uniref:hypothetical protein n=1 Tax=Geothrix limicola TaxID=2927978 RepID=UPI002553A638|nr:hypothetical protein [Geothrix limicola]
MIRSALLITTLLSVIQAADSPILSISPSEQIGFDWLFDMASKNADYAARRRAAGKPEESALILYSLSESLELTHSEIDSITSVVIEYKEKYSDLLAECRFNEIIWKKNHPLSRSGSSTWTAPGFPVNFLTRKNELQNNAYTRLRTELGDNKFVYLKHNCFRTLAPFHGGTLGTPITK